ncbi:hypothetical protein [Hymenobacter elongatus]|uniref:Xanthine dehydrogenase family protein molybdopterin-binding subunit n=1 Tax=Hymenobacter elongatus TaxID=877208 RepID=A0A4Z0PKL9_9BACT|nr:hypothetical protein [Hymenobacter elongatus]TGE16534.1 hypothetical protein E5J99_09115 [Hymenobacter elongatus]
MENHLPATPPSIGRPLSRVDGHLKVTGQARCAAEHAVPGVVHGVLLTSEIGPIGFTAAVANAVYHATRQRIRELPITPDKLVGGPKRGV